MVQIGRIFAELHAGAELAPVVDDVVDAPGGHAGEIVHQRVGAAVAVGALAAMREHGIVLPLKSGERTPAAKRCTNAPSMPYSRIH